MVVQLNHDVGDGEFTGNGRPAGPRPGQMKYVEAGVRTIPTGRVGNQGCVDNSGYFTMLRRNR